MITIRVGGAAISGYGASVGLYRGRGGNCELELSPSRTLPAPPPEAGKIASGLKAPLTDGRKPRLPGLASVEAARAFSAGTFLLPGQIIDRCI